MSYDFEAQRLAWSRPPVDDVGYVPSAELLKVSDDELRSAVMLLFATRFGGLRNADNLWVSTLGLATTHGESVIDYGCGVGVEALAYAWAGNAVHVADFAPDNVELAQRVLQVFGLAAAGGYVVGSDAALALPSGAVDIFHCSGTLHHIPYGHAVMVEAHRVLRPGGEARLMLYSDVGWREATGTEPPDDVETDANFRTFVSYFDQVGGYADWYDRERLERRFGTHFDVREVTYVTPSHKYLTATLARRDV